MFVSVLLVAVTNIDTVLYSERQWRSYFFWRTGRVIKKTTLNRNYQFCKQQLFIKFPFIWLNNLKF